MTHLVESGCVDPAPGGAFFIGLLVPNDKPSPNLVFLLLSSSGLKLLLLLMLE
jgi:hypothetical protein